MEACVATENDDMPELIEAEDEDHSDGWSDADDQLEDNNAVSCIFTGKHFSNPQEYFSNLKSKGFDIWHLVHVDLNLDFFGYVKLINFLRTAYKNKSIPSVEELVNTKNIWICGEQYLKPVLVDDVLLQFMLDEDGENECLNDSEDDSIGDMTEKDFLRIKLLSAERRNENLKSSLAEISNQLSQMKAFMNDIVLKGDIYRPVSACRKQGDILEEEDFEDSGYYGSYSHHDIHAEMLQDKVRTTSYRDAALQNPDAFKDKIVLDVGCGTGILAMFCAKAGAKHVYAVDMSDIAYQAIDIIRENKLQDKITVFKTSVEELTLPVDKVDIIISEWMGYFLLYESMLDSVLHACDKWLKPNGLVLPDSCDMKLVAIHDQSVIDAQIGFWDDVYGFKMSIIKKTVFKEASIQVVKPSSVLSSPVNIFSFSIPQVTTKQLNFKSDFVLEMNQTGECSALVGYFDIYFKSGLTNHISFSTSPNCTATHWKQTVFYLPEVLNVQKGDKVSGHIDCRKNPKDPRSLIVCINVFGQNLTYSVS